MKINAYAAQNATTPLAPFTIQRRDVGKHDVQIDILFCGVCHSDLHTVRSEWQGTTYPCVPGHEIVGRVVKVGKDVNKFKEGDTVGVGRFLPHLCQLQRRFRTILPRYKIYLQLS
jgi:alcohol dehydrogenase (NADP+)